MGTTQQPKLKLATSIASALLAHPDWSQVSPATVRLVQVGGDKADLSAALFAVDFQFDVDALMRHLMFRPVPLDLVPLALPTQRESVALAGTTQSLAAPVDLMATILALLQEQKAASEQQKAASERLEPSQNQLEEEQKAAMNEQKAVMNEQKATME